MVRNDLERRNIRDPRVLFAMRAVPRHLFVPPGLAHEAYADQALPLSDGQSISQPYVVAFMAEALELRPTDRVLEIGTGSGYSAAVASLICAEVFTVERQPNLAERASQTLKALRYDRVHVLRGDGTLGWPEHAPYDGILVTAGGPSVPEALLDQLVPGGRLVMPVGLPDQQMLLRVGRTPKGTVVEERLTDVRFVPLIGEQGWTPAMLQTRRF